MLTQTPEVPRVAPLVVAEADDSDPSTPDVLSLEPGAEALLDSLLPKYVATRIHAALLDSSASESAARRTAMKAATDNAEELSKSLSREANQPRQAQIPRNSARSSAAPPR